MNDYLDGNPVRFALPAYNKMLPVVTPSTSEVVHLAGFESWIFGDNYPTFRSDEDGGIYAGAMYAIRDSTGQYTLKEVNGRLDSQKPFLVSTRTYTLSPFAEDGGGAIYFGGFDANYAHVHNTAWIFRTDLEQVLQ